MPQDSPHSSFVKPWKDYPDDEADVIECMERYAAEAHEAGATKAAIGLVVAVGNYEYLSATPRQRILDKANELLDKLQGKELSWRWG